MKERIVIEGNIGIRGLLINLLKSIPLPFYAEKNKNKIFGSEIESEQVPETWEELKELCRGIKGVEFAGGNAKGEIIQLDNIWFAENGDIWGYSDNWEEVCNIAENRTISQMWNIIKNLIGEE